MEGRFSDQHNSLEAELRLVREELRGLHDTIAQLVSKSALAAPGFLFSPLCHVAFDKVQEKATSIITELGTTDADALKRLNKYSEMFFLRYLDIIKEPRNVANADRIGDLKLAIQCEQNHSPFQQLLFELYQHEFQRRHEKAFGAFQGACEKAELIVLHLSCKERALLASHSSATFDDPLLRNIIVVGHDRGSRGTFNFDPTNNLLVVPADDAYEGLAQKSAAAYAFLAFGGNQACVLKVDDDIRCLETRRLVEQIVPLVRSRHYVGRVWHARYGFARFWHLGKCENRELNLKPYGLLANASYAEGPAYCLSPQAVQVLGKSSVYLEQLFQVEYGYEDLAVGKVLNHYSLTPINYDFIRNGILGSIDAWMMKRAGLPPLEPHTG